MTEEFFRRRGQPVSVVPVSGAAEIAPHLGIADVVVDLTSTGSTLKMNGLREVATVLESSARLVARSRPPMPVYAFTPSAAVARQCAVIYGLHAIESPHHSSTDEMMSVMNRMLVEKGWVSPGDAVVFVAGQPIGIAGSTNMIKLHRIAV